MHSQVSVGGKRAEDGTLRCARVQVLRSVFILASRALLVAVTLVTCSLAGYESKKGLGAIFVFGFALIAFIEQIGEVFWQAVYVCMLCASGG